ncbi:MAG: phospholipid/cholesterol/gamma-HCH transport system permease protein [Gammaproteobacteria bacterium]
MSLVEKIRTLGQATLDTLEELGRMSLLMSSVVLEALRPPWDVNLILEQLRFIGARSVLVIVIAGAFVGMVVALQFYDTLVRFGSVSLLGSAVGLSLIRELGPVLTALIVIGRAGSATCAEIGIMRSDNQIDALESMAIEPTRFLLVPRYIAFLIAVPLLTAIFNVIGIAGGWLIGVGIFELSAGAYFQSMADSVVAHDLIMSLTKSFVFAFVIVWVCTAKSFLMHLNRSIVFGAQGVSKTTTDAVVAASISVLFADYIISALML